MPPLELSQLTFESAVECARHKNKEMPETFDIVVVGAGLMGSAAAYFSAKAGRRVLLLEQFSLLHGNGSSHGSSRIFRVAYSNPTYTQLCLASLYLWKQIEIEGGVQLIQFTGELDFGGSDNVELQEIKSTLTANHVPYEELTAAQANKRFPGFALPEGTHAVYNPTAGVLNPTLAMKTLHRLAKNYGAVIRDSTKVTSVYAEERNGETAAAVEIAGGSRVFGKQAIVTAGPWAKELLGSSGKNIKLQPIATFGAYWHCKEELYAPDKFPVFIKYEGSDEPEVYGMAIVDPSEGVKICLHGGPAVNPNARAGVQEPAEASKKLQAFVKSYFSHVDATAPKKVDDCMYTMTPDNDFILDHVEVPSHKLGGTSKRVVVGAGFSGHGAKMTPVIGQILAELAIKGTTQHPIEMFRADRPGCTVISSAL